MACSERPQARLENYGVGAVSDTELLAMILQGNGTRPEEALTVASRLMAEAGSIAGLAAWAPCDYRRLKGIGHIKGLQLAAIAEIARRMMRGHAVAAPMLNRADAILDAGGVFLACGTCLKLRGSAGTELCPISTMKDMYETIRDADKVVTF